MQKLFAEMIVVESLDVREIWETAGDELVFSSNFLVTVNICQVR